MWLLNTSTLCLERQDGQVIPPYAILSHTWSDGELSHQDIISGDPAARHKRGWVKVDKTCRLASKYGLNYVWIDTCCINQASSAELQEAINSMFKWYEHADICIAYLEDADKDDPWAPESTFRKSRWFTRGWTLQELLVPAEIDFYGSGFEFIATKTDLRVLIAEVTGIACDYIGDYLGFPAESAYERLSKASVAERMSWMADRQTKRQEDVAYCLLGIFNVHMPMLYGEGVKAFQRLQEEIMKVNADASILSWGLQETCCAWRLDAASILAPLPTYFEECRNVMPHAVQGVDAPTFSMHQKGLQLKASMRVDSLHSKLVYVFLGCCRKTETSSPTANKEYHQLQRARRLSSGHEEKRAAMGELVVLPLVAANTETECLVGEEAQQGEYIRPVWCRPIVVSEAFLRDFETREIVLRRQTRVAGDVRGLPFKVEFECLYHQQHTVLSTYPPQPIGTRFCRLGGTPRTKKEWTRKIKRWLSPLVEETRLMSLGYDERSEEGQRLLVVQVASRGTFLLAIDYKVVTVGASSVPWDHELHFRVFSFDDGVCFEALHHLAQTQDFSHLQQLQHSRDRAKHVFRLPKEDDDVLILELSKLSYQVDVSQIRITAPRSAMAPHVGCYHKRNQRLSAQHHVQTGWRKSTRRTLRFI
ncbi:hypothetical protein S40293_00112 [Stachybotrys chartarum IBT 40293]|nr:hypothetical protein S40293_00112 [Stachybotrys chartarum IBT 40293]